MRRVSIHSFPAFSATASPGAGFASSGAGFTSSGAAFAASPASDSRSAASLPPFPLSADCVSTAESVSEQSFSMRGDLFETAAVSFGFYATSRHCIPRLSPRNSNLDEVTANNGAAANGSACHGSCYSGSDPSRAVVAFPHVRGRLLRSTLAATAPRSAVAELESLGVSSRLL